MKGRKTGGRVAGTPNKTTTSVKVALQEAFELRGGVPALLEWSLEDPASFYGLWGKLLPAEINVSGINPIADMLRLAEQRRLEAQIEPVDEPRLLASGE
jgi:hypothetical protein